MRGDARGARGGCHSWQVPGPVRLPVEEEGCAAEEEESPEIERRNVHQVCFIETQAPLPLLKAFERRARGALERAT